MKNLVNISLLAIIATLSTFGQAISQRPTGYAERKLRSGLDLKSKWVPSYTELKNELRQFEPTIFTVQDDDSLGVVLSQYYWDGVKLKLVVGSVDDLIARDSINAIRQEVNQAKSVAQTSSASALSSATSALAFRNEAGNYAQAAAGNSNIYETESAGRAAVSNGTSFLVKGATSDIAYVAYRRVSSSASDTLYKMPSKSMLDAVIKPGDNLLDKDLFVSGSLWSNSTGAIASVSIYKRTPLIELKPNTQYTISGHNTEFLGGLYNSSGTRITKFNDPVNGVSLTAPFTFTTGASNYYIGLNISSHEDTNPGGVDGTVMLAEGTNTTYVPYKKYSIKGYLIEGSISGVATTGQISSVNMRVDTVRDAATYVIREGINKVDKSLIQSDKSWLNGSGAFSTLTGFKAFPTLIKLKTNTQYTISGAKTVFFGGLYNSSGVRQNKLNEPYSQPATSITFTTGSTNNYLGLNTSSVYSTEPSADSSIMLAEGTNSTYVPFSKYNVDATKLSGAIPGVPTQTAFNNVQSSVNSILAGYNSYFKFDGTAFQTLPATYTIDLVGDYVEFEANYLGTSTTNGLGLLGATPAGFINKLGFYSGTQIGIRGNASDPYITWTIPGGVADFKKYRLEVVAGGWQLSVNGVPISTQAKPRALLLNNIGSNYSSGNFIGNLKSVKIHTATSDLNLTAFTGTNIIGVSELKDLPKEYSPIYVSYNPTGLNSKELFTIYVRYANSPFYAGYQVAHIQDNTIRADLWRIYRADLYKLVSGAMIDQGKVIQTLGESEFVFQETGKTDATGGFHGDELLSTVFFYVDGVKLTSTQLLSSFTLRSASEFRYEQVSTIYETDNVTNTARCSHRKITTFNDAGYRTKNSITWASVPAVIAPWYSGISCIAQPQASEYHTENLVYYTALVGSSGPQGNEVGARSVYYVNPTNQLGAHVESRITKIIASTIDRTAEFDSQAVMQIYDDGSTRSKYYRNLNGKTPAIGDIWESEMKVRHYIN